MKAEDANLEILVRHRTTVQDLLDDITLSTDGDVLFVLVASIDEAVADWNFTEQCFEHFKKLMEEHDRE